MDAMQKMYARGWDGGGEWVKGVDGGLCYCWVVEVPKNKDGEDNPHVHLLMDWRVKRRHFDAWSKRIENIWGHGWAHLEKMKEPEKAGAYMAKASSYLTKAQGMSDQGRVAGNRYGISKPARAPGFEVIAESQLHSMGQIIREVYENLTEKYGYFYQARKWLSRRLAELPKGASERKIVGMRLETVRGVIADLPIRSNGYQVIVKGIHAAQNFFAWAKGERPAPGASHWLPDQLPAELAWVPGERPAPADRLQFVELRKKFQAARRWLSESRFGRLVDRLIGEREAERFGALVSYREYEFFAHGEGL